MPSTELILEHADRDVQRLSLSAMPSEIRLLDDVLLHINNGLAMITGQSNDRGLNFLALLLLNGAFNSLWRARGDAVDGYPVQSLALIRAAMEDWGTCYYVERHPETCDRWLSGVLTEIDTAKRPPQFSDIWTDLGEHLGTTIAKEAYGHLSKFAHPRGVGLNWLFHSDVEQTYFHVGPHFSERDLKTCLYFAMSIGQMLFQRVGALQERVLSAVDPEWFKLATQLSESVESFIDRIHAEYARGEIQLD